MKEIALHIGVSIGLGLATILAAGIVIVVWERFGIAFGIILGVAFVPIVANSLFTLPVHTIGGVVMYFAASFGYDYWKRRDKTQN